MQDITWEDVLVAALAVIEARGANSPALDVETMVRDLTTARHRIANTRPRLQIVANG